MLKSFIRKIALFVVLTSAVLSPVFAKVDYIVENQPLVMERVLQFEQRGVLKQKENGYLYLEVSRNFVAEALLYIYAPGKLVPPSHYTSKHGIGAHISVMYEDELIDNEIWEIHELGEVYTFTVLELRTVKLYKDNSVQKLWLLAVDAPELELLRINYGLKPKLNNHDFHITIGTQVPGKAAEEPLKEAA